MKITRNYAIEMFHRLGQMAFGHLSEETLEKVLNNRESLRSVAEQFDRLNEELNKRLYEGVDKEKLNAFREIIQKMKGKKGEQLMDLDKLARETYPELCELRMKEVRVSLSLLNNEVEVDIKEIDGMEFRKAILKVRPDTKLEDFDWFIPMFKKVKIEEDEENKKEKTEEKKDTDFTELDKLLK